MDATVVVTDTVDVGPDTVSIEFEAPEEFEAQPGQFVKLSAAVDGERYSRFYTISSPDMIETFEVTIEIDPDESGPFSEYLAALSPGDEIDMSGPFGSDYYENEPRVVILAGGPGIGPAVGIGERVISDGGELAIVYQDDAPAHEDRLSTLTAAGAAVAITDGSITEAVEAVVTGQDGEQIFIYGFGSFVEEAIAAVEAAGGDPDDLKVENFG
jgi:ferredoxin-NADP reductase